MKNNTGAVEIIAAIGILVVILVGVFVLSLRGNSEPVPSDFPQTVEGEGVPVMDPLSNSTEQMILEKELGETELGDFEADIESMEMETSGL